MAKIATSDDRIVVCFPFIGDHVGGSHISATGLIRNLDTTRFRPLVVLHDASGPLAEFLRQVGVPFEVAPVPSYINPVEGTSGHGLSTVAAVVRSLLPQVDYLRRRGVDIVHTNDGRVHVTWGLAARLAGAKLLWHHRSDPNSLGLRCVAPWLANRLVAVSHFASPKGWLSARRKCSVVRSPFEVSRLLKVDRAAGRERLMTELGGGPSMRILGYVGNLQDRKRPLVFVDAIAETRRMLPGVDVQGVFFGESFAGYDRMVAARASELGISDHVHLMGFRYPGEQWMAALDLLMVTAVKEPYGRTLIEAMLMGVPVVAAASGGNLEAIEDGVNGILVPPDMPSAFAEAARKLLADSDLRREIVDRARADAQSRHGIENHVGAVSEIYEKLAASSRWQGVTGGETT
jgi:glycosyltransferase involved in cell wall biosynthesis